VTGKAPGVVKVRGVAHGIGRLPRGRRRRTESGHLKSTTSQHGSIPRRVNWICSARRRRSVSAHRRSGRRRDVRGIEFPNAVPHEAARHPQIARCGRSGRRGRLRRRRGRARSNGEVSHRRTERVAGSGTRTSSPLARDEERPAASSTTGAPAELLLTAPRLPAWFPVARLAFPARPGRLTCRKRAAASTAEAKVRGSIRPSSSNGLNLLEDCRRVTDDRSSRLFFSRTRRLRVGVQCAPPNGFPTGHRPTVVPLIQRCPTAMMQSLR